MSAQQLTVYATSDLHAHWLRQTAGAGAKRGGIAHVGAFLTGIDRSSSILIDNGDTLTGSPLGAFLASRVHDNEHPVFAELDRLGFDVGVPGNHDFDNGIDRLRRHVAALHTMQYVSANCQGSDQEPIFSPSVVIERAGLRIGVIGAVTGHVQRLTRYEAVAGIHFVNPVTAIAAEAARLRPVVDILIVSYHGGFAHDVRTGRETQYDTGEDQASEILATVPGIDGLIAGHQHRGGNGFRCRVCSAWICWRADRGTSVRGRQRSSYRSRSRDSRPCCVFSRAR